MAKSKMNQDFIKNLLLGVSVILALYILQTLVYKFIGFDLWDILKVKKEEFKNDEYSTKLMEENRILERDYKKIEKDKTDIKNKIYRLGTKQLKMMVPIPTSKRRHKGLRKKSHRNKKNYIKYVTNEKNRLIKQREEKEKKRLKILRQLNHNKKTLKQLSNEEEPLRKKYQQTQQTQQKLQQLSISPKDHCNKCLNYIESNLS